MFSIVRKSIEWGGRTLELETGKIARQADGSVVARYGRHNCFVCSYSCQKGERKASTSFH